MTRRTSLSVAASLTLTLFVSQSAFAQHCEDGVCRLKPQTSDTNDLLPSMTRPNLRPVLSNSSYRGDCEQRPSGPPQYNRSHGEADFFAPAPRVDDYELPVPQPTAIRWERSFDRGEQLSRRSGRPMLVRITADWCGHCTRMKQTTYRHNGIVQDVNAAFIPIELNADQNRELIEQMRVQSLPATLVITPDRRIVAREQGFRTAEQLGGTLRRFMQRAELIRPFKVAVR